MSDIVLVAVISLIGTLGGSFSGIIIANRLTTYRIEQLEKKVDKHNSLVEWKCTAEGRFELVDEQIKVANHRIDDLEKG